MGAEMELDAGPINRTDIYEWHDWYAWRPVIAVDEDTDRRKLVWLKVVGRMRVMSLAIAIGESYWAYRIKR